MVGQSSVRSVLVLNAGSSSLKWVVLDAQSERVLQQGQASWQGAEANQHSSEVAAALEHVPEVQAVGHRVVHGGTRFRNAVLVDEQVRDEILKLAELAPLHNAAAVAGMDAVHARLPDVPQVAAFDTAFHANMPEAAAVYPLPADWTARWGLRRFGFHGLSVAYAVSRTRDLLGRVPRRIVVCHLGAGCSITAVTDGQSADTSMGFTPLEGLMMAQRSGSIDPGLLLYLQTRRGVSVADLDRALNERSGLLGVSTLSADMREVLAAADAGHAQAKLARDMFVHRVVSGIGGMLATLHGLDALVFTGGIGEHSAPIRAAVSAAFGFLELQLDPALNDANPADADIASSSSRVRVLVVTAREDLSVVREVRTLLGGAGHG